MGGQAPATIAAPAPVVAYAGLTSWHKASFPTIIETTSSCSWTKIHNPWLHRQRVLEPHDQSDIAGALPVAQHSAVAIASHAIPAGVIIIQSSFENFGFSRLRYYCPTKSLEALKEKTVSEHHSVPIVPLTTATAHPHGFSYGFAMFSQMITLLILSFLCIFPSIWGLPTPFRWQWKCDLSASFLNSQQIRPAQSNSTESHLLIVVDRCRFTTHHLGKREAGIIGYHGGFLGGESESSWYNIRLLLIQLKPSAPVYQFKNPPSGYLGHHGLVGLKSAPCVNVNNVPVPCAHPGLLHHGYLG